MFNHLYILLELYPNAEWDYEFLSRNPNITWDIVKANLDKKWDYEFLSENSNITWDIVKANPDKPWSYENLSSNPNITWDMVQNNPNIFDNYIWLSKNPNITWDIVKANPDKRWNYFWLSMNKFNKDPYLVKKRSMIKYGIIWLNKTRETKEYQRLWNIEYSASMDILKLRQRDFELTRD